MNHLTVGFDVDDVLLPSGSHTIRWYNHHFGTQLTVEHWYKNIPLEPWQVQTEDEIVDRVNAILGSEGYLSEIVPMDGATRLLDEIEAAGDDKFGATSRPPLLAKMTHKALEKCYPGVFPEGTVSFINHSTASGSINTLTKVAVALSHHATHFIDDFEHHLRPMREVGITPMLAGDWPWNQNITTPGLHRYVDLDEAREKLAYDRSA